MSMTPKWSIRETTFAEAQQLINAGEAGYFAMDSPMPRPHDTQMCVFDGRRWFVVGDGQIQIIDHGLAGSANDWTRAIEISVHRDHPIVKILHPDLPTTAAGAAKMVVTRTEHFAVKPWQPKGVFKR